jgi:hypothetical protein
MRFEFSDKVKEFQPRLQATPEFRPGNVFLRHSD